MIQSYLPASCWLLAGTSRTNCDMFVHLYAHVIMLYLFISIICILKHVDNLLLYLMILMAFALMFALGTQKCCAHSCWIAKYCIHEPTTKTALHMSRIGKMSYVRKLWPIHSICQDLLMFVHAYMHNSKNMHVSICILSLLYVLARVFFRTA